MVTIVKHEWHQVDSQFAYELDEDKLSEIYPDLDEDEISDLMRQIEDGEVSVDEVMEAAYDNDVEIEWDRQYDDWWTDRKGGYEVTYELGDDDSWHSEPPPPEPTHKCTKCRWEGSKYEASTAYLREDGTVIQDYWNSDEESSNEKRICPMCDSDTELTEAGKEEEDRHNQMMKMFEEDDE